MKILVKIMLGVLSLSSVNSFAQQSMCYDGVCVGEQVYNTLRDFRLAQVIGIEHGSKFVIRFYDNNGVGGNWDREDLAKISGCAAQYCVGQTAYNITREYRMVSVVGIQYNGDYVLRFHDNNGVGGNWSDSDLARRTGCGRDFCVGSRALNNKRNYREVTVVGIQSDLKYVLQFSDNGNIGGNWDDEDLVQTSPNPPQPPPYPGPGPTPTPGYRVIEGVGGVNARFTPYDACRAFYNTTAIYVEARGQRYSCNQETCGHIYEWTRVYCTR